MISRTTTLGGERFLQFVGVDVLRFPLPVGFELATGSVPLWAGLVVAVVVYIGYPRVRRKAGIAPTH